MWTDSDLILSKGLKTHADSNIPLYLKEEATVLQSRETTRPFYSKDFSRIFANTV